MSRDNLGPRLDTGLRFQEKRDAMPGRASYDGTQRHDQMQLLRSEANEDQALSIRQHRSSSTVSETAT